MYVFFYVHDGDEMDGERVHGQREAETDEHAHAGAQRVPFPQKRTILSETMSSGHITR